MLITSFVSIPIESQEPRDAVAQFARVLRAAVREGDSVKLTMALRCVSDFAAMATLLDAIPEDAGGFDSLSGGERKAGWARRVIDSGRTKAAVSYMGKLTDHLPFGEALSLVERISESIGERAGGREPRGVGISAHAFDFRWPGALEDTTSKLSLSDAWPMWPKIPYTLEAFFTLRGGGSDDPAVLSALKSAAEASGISFHKGKLHEAVDPSETEAFGPERQFVVDVCYHHAFEEAAERVRAMNLPWRELPGVSFTTMGVFRRRMADTTAGKSAQVNFRSVVKTFLKAELAEFRSRKVGFGDVVVTKPISDEWEMSVNFQPQRNQGLGKTYTVDLGVYAVAGPASGYWWRSGIFRLDGWLPFEGLSPKWSYLTKEELEEQLAALGSLLRQILPALEDSFRRWIVPLPTAIPEGIVRRGAISAREAWNEARGYVLRWSADAILIWVEGGPVYPGGGSGMWLNPREHTVDSGLDIEGRAKPHGIWTFTVSSPSGEERADVEVPATGPVRFQRFPRHDSQASSMPGLSAPCGEEWIDSSQAMAVVAAALAEDPLPDQSLSATCELRIQEYVVPQEPLAWKVCVASTGPGGTHRRGFMVGAHDGRLLSSSRS